MSKSKNELGKVIAEAREKLGLSQRKLAKLANIDSAEVSRIEAGKRQKPNILYLKAIASVLNLSLVELMKLADYSDAEINWGNDLSDKRSEKDYQNQIKEYERFYFDILSVCEDRRKNAFACKGAIYDIIDKLENKKISNDEIIEELQNIIAIIQPSLEKVDKSIYPNIDNGVLPKMDPITNGTKYSTLTGEIIKEEK